MALALPPDLSAAQAAIWLDQQLFPGKPVYNTGQVLTIRGKLRVDLFEIALSETIAESPGLRLPPWSEQVPFDLKVLDFRNEKDPLILAERWMRTEMGRVIPLEDPALFCFALLQVGDDYWLWFQKFHHIIIDATGRRLLSARTACRYRALRFGEPLSVMKAATPGELLDVEQRYMASTIYDADRNYWREQFVRWPGPLHEIDRANTERIKSGRPARASFTLKRGDFARLEAVARQLGSSAFRAIIALTFAAFARLYDRYDIVLGLELANRPDARSKETIGFLARPIPMLLTLCHSATVADTVRRVEEITAQSYPHRKYPVQELARELEITRKGHHGLFDVIVNYVPCAYDFRFEELPVELTNLSYGFTAPWTVTIADTGSTRDIDVSIDSDPGLISTDMAARLAACLEILLRQGMDDLACPLASLPIMSDATRDRVLGLASGEVVALPKEATLATLCAAQAERTPNAIALIYGEQQVSFATLHDQAARLARRLTAHGVGPGVVVGIALPREPALVVAVLAVHKAGGAYLALDPAYPAERIRFIVSDSAAPVILTNAALAPSFAHSGARLLLEDEPGVTENGMADPVTVNPTDLAYVLYTSGSTGLPKAVGIRHCNLINLITWGRSIVSDSDLRGLLFSTSLNFDLSAFEMFLPLAFGGCIVLVENLLTLQSAPQRDKVRLINTGPTLFDALLRTGGLPAAVTTVILAGEKLSRRLADSLFEAAPGIRLLNCYGPTETTVYSSCARIDPSARSEPTIGRAIWNTTLHVLDSGRALVPPGAEGELFIGGEGVSQGYLGRPELTDERFLPNPFGLGKLYRTGDRVRWCSDELEFLGRYDDQMKINGIRIEPGEIEAALLGLAGIAAAVVMAREDTGGLRRLTAYLVASSEKVIAEGNLRAALERQLPRNMVPTYFVWLDAMPMTPNGKLDRKALPAPMREEDHSPDHQMPQTRLECDIAAIWEELLSMSPIDIRTDFFDLGGDSLALISLFAAIEARFGRRLTVDVLSGGLTVVGLAQILAQKEPQQEDLDPVAVLQPLGDRPPFFCVHGIGGDLLHLHRLAMRMGTDRPFFGLRRTPEARPTDTISQIAARYVKALLARQPAGPFYLGGHSFGATVAYEMALQLSEQGHDIGLLAIIDQRKPGWRLTVSQALPFLHLIILRMLAQLRDELRQARPTDRLRMIRRTLSLWSRRALGYRATHLMFDFSRMDTEQIAFYEGGLRALLDYRPRPAPIKISLFRAKVPSLSNLALDSTLGWNELGGSDVRVHVVPGNHGSMMTEPMVRELAKAISEQLEACASSIRSARAE